MEQIEPSRYEFSDEQWNQIEADFENLSIDSTSVRAHQHSAGAKKSWSSRSCPTHWSKSWRQHNENSYDCRCVRQPACDMLDQLTIEGNNVLGDKAYDAQAIRNKLTSKGSQYTMPPRTKAKEPCSVNW